MGGPESLWVLNKGGTYIGGQVTRGTQDETRRQVSGVSLPYDSCFKDGEVGGRKEKVGVLDRGQTSVHTRRVGSHPGVLGTGPE